MEQYVGMDVSLKETSICVVYDSGVILSEGTVVSEPAAIAKFIQARADGAKRIGLETGPTTTWLWHELRAVGLPVICIDARRAKAAATRVLNATWQRCRVYFMRNLLAHAGRQGRRVVSAFVATAFAQEDAEAAKTQWRQVADQLRPKAAKLATFMDEAEPDVLAYMTFPRGHRTKLHSTYPLERLNGEIKRRTNVVRIFPNEAAITRLIGAILLEQNDEWAVQRARTMTLETIAQTGHDDLIKLPSQAA